MLPDLGTVLTNLYASEINCGLASFWDGGWVAWLGDDLNGRKAEETFLDEDLSEVAGWLAREAFLAYPESGFSKSMKPLYDAHDSREARLSEFRKLRVHV